MAEQCECYLCQRGRRIRDVLTGQSVSDKNALIAELHDALTNTEEALEYKRCILQGWWPSAVEQLEHALKLARDKRAADHPEAVEVE